LAQRNASVRFVPTCSRPDDPRNIGWTGQVGRVHTIVERYVHEWELKPAETCIYACGHPQMIEDLRTRYAGTGFEFEEERFWKPQ
jgi:ferredoxin--NADP+ reductase